MSDRLLLDKEALASALSVSISTIDRMNKAGTLPAPTSKISGRVLWVGSEIEAWLTGDTTKAAQPKKRGRKRLAID